jgi:hypothetical protein
MSRFSHHGTPFGINNNVFQRKVNYSSLCLFSLFSFVTPTILLIKIQMKANFNFVSVSLRVVVRGSRNTENNNSPIEISHHEHKLKEDDSKIEDTVDYTIVLHSNDTTPHHRPTTFSTFPASQVQVAK